jgi:hypothetical protein
LQYGSQEEEEEEEEQQQILNSYLLSTVSHDEVTPGLLPQCRPLHKLRDRNLVTSQPVARRRAVTVPTTEKTFSSDKGP